MLGSVLKSNGLCRETSNSAKSASRSHSGRSAGLSEFPKAAVRSGHAPTAAIGRFTGRPLLARPRIRGMAQNGWKAVIAALRWRLGFQVTAGDYVFRLRARELNAPGMPARE